MAISITNPAAIAACDAIVDLVDAGGGAGVLNIYGGTVPANATEAISGQTLLAELPMSATSFGAAADANPGATATANAITSDADANATGTATFFRILDFADAVILQGTVGIAASGADLILSTVDIVADATVEVSSLTVTMPESA